MANKVLTLIKGQNTPIVVTLQNIDFTLLTGCSLSIFSNTHARLYNSTSPVIDATNKTLTFPVSQRQSIEWTSGECAIELKMMVDGKVIFAKKVDGIILSRDDNTVFTS